MKVKRVVMLASDHAVVHLSPSWLARLFGAKDVVCELQWFLSPCESPSSYSGWHNVHSRRHIDYMPHSSLLRSALEFQPLQIGDKDAPIAVPEARLLEEQE